MANLAGSFHARVPDLRKADWLTDSDMDNLISGRMFIGSQPAHMLYAALVAATLAQGLCAAHGGEFPTVSASFRAEVLLRMMPPRQWIFNMHPGRYPWHTNIETTVFWCMEPATANSPSNFQSVYDSFWFRHFSGESAYYAAVPYCDVENGHTKPEAVRLVPWFHQSFRADGVSVMKDRWIEIRFQNRRCFAQIKDVGPYHVDDADYVFRNTRPQSHANNSAALDVSPAVKDALGLHGLDQCAWRFVDASEVTPGPWRAYGGVKLAFMQKGSQR
jgi:hypothetical protein